MCSVYAVNVHAKLVAPDTPIRQTNNDKPKVQDAGSSVHVIRQLMPVSHMGSEECLHEQERSAWSRHYAPACADEHPPPDNRATVRTHTNHPPMPTYTCLRAPWATQNRTEQNRTEQSRAPGQTVAHIHPLVALVSALGWT